jgi:hypothetical protein
MLAMSQFKALLVLCSMLSLTYACNKEEGEFDYLTESLKGTWINDENPLDTLYFENYDIIRPDTIACLASNPYATVHYYNFELESVERMTLSYEGTNLINVIPKTLKLIYSEENRTHLEISGFSGFYLQWRGEKFSKVE